MSHREGEEESGGGRVEQKLQELHEAIVEGNNKLEAFKEILNEDPKILDRIKVGCFIHTPLHVAAYHGHLEFVKEILKRSPGLVEVQDSRRWSPLHVASARGHLDIVQALVSENPDMCTALDGDARTPLHLAAMKGNLDVLKMLFEASLYGPHELMNVKDVAGNTILHLAVRNKKLQVVDYLLKKIEKAEKTENRIKAVNAINNCGYTAYDIVMDSKNEQEFKDIKVSFRKVKAMQAKDLSQGDWLSKKRDILMVVASLIATMAFQAGINPPGGFWPDNAALHRAGEAIMAYNYPNTYPYFIRANTTGFVASVSTILLLVTGWPFKKKFFMWLLVVIMWVTITSIAFTYAFSIVVVSPKGEREPLFHTIVVGAIVWCCVMASLLIAHAIRVNWWLKTNKGINVWPQIKDFFKSKTSRQGTNSINGDVNQI
ncbi:ankyrin repeat-containing protein ITN1-like isoform X3 [Camellia sinensis]|uniref:ankyrin repeat-containing protein ITN1-like isoform X3 n=1 Tax=Camellia sinensis TaxID=4442 RepID=UPI00103658D0|nr:ankyrin repeat-containing protein ITN1-like isoform X3 [Camellia sinensis]